MYCSNINQNRIIKSSSILSSKKFVQQSDDVEYRGNSSTNNINLFANCILVFVNLEDWLSNQVLCNLCDNALWVHRETQDIAYVGFNDLDKAYAAYQKLNNCTYHNEAVNSLSTTVSKTRGFQQYNHCEVVSSNKINNNNNNNNEWSLNKYFESFDHVVENTENKSQITFKIHYAAPFLEVRYCNLFLPYTDIVKRRSCFLKIQSSYRVSLNQWAGIFRNAFDFYRSSDNSRVFIEFPTVEQADEARKQVHMRLLPFVYKDCIRNVLVSAVFVSKKLAMKKTQLYLSTTKNERIVHEEKLSNQIVDWLYNSSC